MKTELFEYFTTDNISGKKCTEKWLKKNNEILFNIIINWCDNFEILKEIEFKRKVYHYINEMINIPKCKTCNGEVKYLRIKDGYGTYCSDKCVKLSDEYYNKWLSSVRVNMEATQEKRKKTLEAKYGKSYNKVIQKNREASMNSKYGVLNSFQILEIQKKRKDVLIEKYNDEFYNNPDKTRMTRIKNGTQINDEVIDNFIDYKKVVMNRTLSIYRNNYKLINPENLKRSKKGYHIDHLFSIKQGFLQNIPIEIITHPCNLQMIYYKDNIKKQDECWISKDELLNNIIKYDGVINFKHKHLRESYSNIVDTAKNLLILLESSPDN